MMSFYASSATLGRTGKLFSIVVAILLVAGISATQASAGDLSAQPRDSLSVVGSNTGVLPGAAGALPGSGGPVAAESGWLSRFHVTGYLSEQFGMWQNPSALRSLTPARNNLAVARTTLQIDENFQLDENNSFFMREWFTYDPPYSWNSANNKRYSRAQSCVFTSPSPVVPGICDKVVPGGGVSVGPHSYGHFTNDALNQYDVRDAWWQNKWGPLTTFVGNQIVVWGQSLSFRVGDIVNPNDTAWAFGFANLEQSRKPQWMVHPILNLPDFGPLSTNFLELVLSPGWDPQWWECDYADQRYDFYMTKCGRQLTGQASLSSSPLMRFEPLTPQHIYKYGVFADPAKGVPINGPFDLGESDGSNQFTGAGNNGFIAGGGFFERTHCSSGPFNLTSLFGAKNGVVNVYDQVPLFLRRPCVRLSKGFNTAGALGNGSSTDFGRFRIRGYAPQWWNEYFRFHTLIGDTELTTFIGYDNTNQGAQAVAKWVHPYTNLFEYDEPAEVLAGLTANRPVPLPEIIASHFPVVAKAEAVWINHKQFDDRRPYVLTTRRFSDVVNWLAALDLTNAYAPWLSSTGDLSANLEVNDSITMDIAKDMDANDRNPVHILKNPIQILFNAGTSWYYGDIAPTWTMIYGLKGNTFLMFPSVTLNPPWTKKYFVRFSAIEVLGGDRQAAQVGGTLKGQSFLSALLQYNFQLR
jgi:hypothetical protein